MSQPNKPNNGQQSTKSDQPTNHNSETLGLITLNACIKQLLSEGLAVAVDEFQDGVLRLIIPGLELVDGANGKRRIARCKTVVAADEVPQ